MTVRALFQSRRSVDRPHRAHLLYGLVVLLALTSLSCPEPETKVVEGFDGPDVPASITALGGASLAVESGALVVTTAGGEGGFRWTPGIEGIVCTRLLDLEIPEAEFGRGYTLRWIAVDAGGNEFDAAVVEIFRTSGSVRARGKVTKNGDVKEFDVRFHDIDPSDIRKQRIDFVERGGRNLFYVELVDKTGKLHMVGPFDPDLPNVVAVSVVTDLDRLAVGGLESDVVHHEEDEDDDGLSTAFDNCPQDANPDQEDSDGDGLGDACDPRENVTMRADELRERLPVLAPELYDLLAETRGRPLHTDPALRDAVPPLPSLSGLEPGAVLSGRIVVSALDLLPEILDNPRAFDLPLDPPDFPVYSDVERVDLEYDGGDGVWVSIETQYGPALGDLYELLWDTESAPSGDVTLRLRMTDGSGNVGFEEVPVQVNKLPVPTIDFETLEQRGTRTNVRLDGSSSSDPDGEIVDWRWELPGGQTLQGPEVVTELDVGGDGATVTLTVIDDLGGIGEDTVTLTTDEHGDISFGTEFCECEEMDIRDSGEAGATVEFPAELRRQGPGTTSRSLGSNVVPDGDGFGRVRLNFEVFAKLKDKSTASECDEQQKISATILHGGHTIIAAKVGTDGDGDDYSRPGLQSATAVADRFPYDPDRLIQDTSHGYKEEFKYNGQEQIKDHVEDGDSREVRWLDAPGTRRVPEAFVNGNDNDGFEMELAFEAVVGNCRCTWQVEAVIDKDGNVTTPPRIREELCTF